MENKISVIIPVHNKEMYLVKTLKSVENQSYSSFEVILINDGSTDKSGIICDEYKLTDQRISVYHQKNQGVSSARNLGIRKAKYNYIAFLDADDLWDPNFLMEMNNLINRFPNVNMYSSKFATINNKQITYETFFKNTETSFEFDMIEFSCSKARLPLNSSSVIIKKTAIEKAGYFDERISVFEDFDLFIRIAINSKVAYLNKQPLSFYKIDIPAENKARGKVPDIRKNWIYFMDKFNEERKLNLYLDIFLDRATLDQILFYRHYKKYNKELSILKKKINKQNYSTKHKILLILPVLCGDILLTIFHKYKSISSKKQEHTS